MARLFFLLSCCLLVVFASGLNSSKTLAAEINCNDYTRTALKYARAFKRIKSAGKCKSSNLLHTNGAGHMRVCQHLNDYKRKQRLEQMGYTLSACKAAKAELDRSCRFYVDTAARQRNGIRRYVESGQCKWTDELAQSDAYFARECRFLTPKERDQRNQLRINQARTCLASVGDQWRTACSQYVLKAGQLTFFYKGKKCTNQPELWKTKQSDYRAECKNLTPDKMKTRNSQRQTALNLCTGKLKTDGEDIGPGKNALTVGYTLLKTRKHCPSNLANYRGRKVLVQCKCVKGARPGHSVWGTDTYTDDSSPCNAAVHAGVLPKTGGDVIAKMLPGEQRYVGSTRNGVTTRSYAKWHGSFQIVEAKNAKSKTAPLPPSGARGYEYIKVGQCPGDMTMYRGRWVVLECTCDIGHANPAGGTAYGTREYTDFSTLCLAARHSGAFFAHTPTPFRVKTIKPPHKYFGTTVNGVTSLNYGRWEQGAFTVIAGTVPGVPLQPFEPKDHPPPGNTANNDNNGNNGNNPQAGNIDAEIDKLKPGERKTLANGINIVGLPEIPPGKSIAELEAGKPARIIEFCKDWAYDRVKWAKIYKRNNYCPLPQKIFHDDWLKHYKTCLVANRDVRDAIRHTFDTNGKDFCKNRK